MKLRGWLMVWGLAGAVLLGVSLWITPAEQGLGSHEQLGLSSCGFYLRTGYPCPTCGMTTAFALTARGQLWEAFGVQPAGMVLALTIWFSGIYAFYAAITGRGLERVRKLRWEKVLAGAVVLVLLSWGIKLLEYRH